MYLMSNIKKIALSSVLVFFSAYGGESNSNKATASDAKVIFTKQDSNKPYFSKNNNDTKEAGIAKKTIPEKGTKKHGRKTDINEETIFPIEETLMIEEISCMNEKIGFPAKETLMIEEVSNADFEKYKKGIKRLISFR